MRSAAVCGLQGFTLNTTPIHHDTWTDTDTFMRWHALGSNDSYWRPSSRPCRVWVDFALTGPQPFFSSLYRASSRLESPGCRGLYYFSSGLCPPGILILCWFFVLVYFPFIQSRGREVLYTNNRRTRTTSITVPSAPSQSLSSTWYSVAIIQNKSTVSLLVHATWILQVLLSTTSNRTSFSLTRELNNTRVSSINRVVISPNGRRFHLLSTMACSRMTSIVAILVPLLSRTGQVPVQGA